MLIIDTNIDFYYRLLTDFLTIDMSYIFTHYFIYLNFFILYLLVFIRFFEFVLSLDLLSLFIPKLLYLLRKDFVIFYLAWKLIIT